MDALNYEKTPTITHQNCFSTSGTRYSFFPSDMELFLFMAPIIVDRCI